VARSENRLVKTVTASFNKILGKLTEMSQRKKTGATAKNDVKHVSCYFSSSCYLRFITSHCWCETREWNKQVFLTIFENGSGARVDFSNQGPEPESVFK